VDGERQEIGGKVRGGLCGWVDPFDEEGQRRGWSLLSEAALRRVWDNDADAAYDNWRELYGVPRQIISPSA